MKYKDFEDFMMWEFAKENPSVLDDYFPDSFDDWLCSLEPDNWIEYGQKYAITKEIK